jgi:hypothetical protein
MFVQHLLRMLVVMVVDLTVGLQVQFDLLHYQQFVVVFSLLHYQQFVGLLVHLCLVVVVFGLLHYQQFVVLLFHLTVGLLGLSHLLVLIVDLPAGLLHHLGLLYHLCLLMSQRIKG